MCATSLIAGKFCTADPQGSPESWGWDVTHLAPGLSHGPDTAWHTVGTLELSAEGV